MTVRLLTTSMGILLLAMVFNFQANAKNWNQDSGVTIYGNGYQSFDGWAIPWDKTPNYATAKFYLKRYLTSDDDGINNIRIQPSSKPLGIIKRNTQSLNIQQEMQTTSLLSYMLYDGGELIVDEITPRFDGKIRDDTLLYSMSLGKSLTSYLLGHAICNGHIEGLDHELNDWPLIKNTLYEGQKLVDLINMTTGDQEHVRFSDGLVKTDRGYNTATIRSIVNNELKDSKSSQKIFNYSSLPSNLVLNYLDFRLDYKLNEFMSNVLQNHVRIAGPLVQKSALFKNFDENSAGIYRANFRATRHDFLRIGIAILSDWQEGNCVGSYLKEIYERKIRKNTASPARNKTNKWGGNYWPVQL